jgi:methylase of polypeptide subunit release factors
MKIETDPPALSLLRRYLDETMYAMIDFRLSFEAPVSPTGFPRFDDLKKVVARLDPVHRALFQLFRLGEAVDDAAVEASLPNDVLGGLQRAGLLRRQHDGGWRTENLLLVPIEGILVFVSVPPSYPTATAPCTAWFDLSSYVFAKALPSDLESETVLDVCSGSGVQSLLCAKHGAAFVTGLEIDPDAVALAKCNAEFNGLSERTEFRQSDKLAALREGEQFDFILCNGPYAPVTDAPEAPASLGAIGNRVLIDIIDGLPLRLAAGGRGIVALWRSIGTRSSNQQRAHVTGRLADAGLTSLAFVDRAQDGLEGVLRILQTDAGQRYGTESGATAAAAARALVADAGAAVDGSYNQLLFFKADTHASNGDARIFGLESAAITAGGR